VLSRTTESGYAGYRKSSRENPASSEQSEWDVPATAAISNEFHALLVTTGKDYCKPNPRCSPCPLDRLPHTIDIECE